MVAKVAKSAEAGAPESETVIEITPEMVRTGVQVLKEQYLSLQELEECPEIVRIVFLAMLQSRQLRV